MPHKRARLAKNLTLKEVERKAQVSATHISEIERGLTSPTVGALWRIAAALDAPPFHFLATDPRRAASVVLSLDRPALEDTSHGGRFLRLSHGVRGGDLSSFIVELEAGDPGRAQPLPHEGEEFFHVLRGVVELDVPGADRRVVLKEGDSIHFKGEAGRVIRNIGDATAQVFWTVTPPLCL
jgi:transcriptional regulator with XRE-family HTH domain